MANPSGLRWVQKVGGALGRAGLLRAYLTPVAIGSRARRHLVGLPGPISGLAEDLVERRSVPTGVGERDVQRVATTSELTYAVAVRLPGVRRIAPDLGYRRSRIFDSAVGRRLQAGDRAVLVQRASALRTIRAAHRLGIRSFLDFPIPPQRWSRALLEEEARLNPEFAETLQNLSLGGHEARLDRELAEADFVFALCRFHRRTLIESGVPEDRVALTPLGVDLELFRPAARPDDGRFRVLFVGQLTQRKGLSYLLDGFELASIPDSELVLHGRTVGSSRPWEGRRGVRHVPMMSLRDLVGLYANCDAFVLPSLIEGFGQTPLEAMACGRPVIVSRHTFADDIVDDEQNGFVVPIRDAEAIAERLQALYDSPSERARIGSAARERAEQFPWSRYTASVIESIDARS